MSKMAELLIEVEDRLRMGYAANEVAKQLSIPVEWVIDTELELMGMHQYGEDDECN